MSNDVTPEKIPNKAFDMEYMTQWGKEQRYLQDHGIRYEFVKRNPYGIREYKYRKTPQLFSTLARFYQQQEYEKEFDDVLNDFDSVCHYEGSAGDSIQEAINHLPMDTALIPDNVVDQIISLLSNLKHA